MGDSALNYREKFQNTLSEAKLHLQRLDDGFSELTKLKVELRDILILLEQSLNH
jgi:hypothetical protein